MYCKPSLIVPIDSSEKSIRKNKVYDSPTEMYTLVESSLDKQIHGVYTPLTRCYSMSCLPGQPGCYSASCPNKVYSLNGTIFKKPAKSVLSSSSHDTVNNIQPAFLLDILIYLIDTLTRLVGYCLKRNPQIHA